MPKVKCFVMTMSFDTNNATKIVQILFVPLPYLISYSKKMKGNEGFPCLIQSIVSVSNAHFQEKTSVFCRQNKPQEVLFLYTFFEQFCLCSILISRCALTWRKFAVSTSHFPTSFDLMKGSKINATNNRSF